MAMTLVEASKLSNDTILQGVIDVVATESDALQRLPFIEVVGNGWTYNRLDSAPTAGFYDVGDTWSEDTPTFEQVTAVLKIMGGDADVDQFLAQTRSNIQDLEAEVLQLKAKAVANLFDDTFINGDEGSDPNSFDGLAAHVTAGQTVSMGTNGAVLTLDKLDELIDKSRGGKPDVLFMSRRTRRQLNSLARTSGTFLETDRDEFGRVLQFYDGIPLGINDYIADDDTVGTSNDCSTIYGVRFSAADGLTGITSPGGLQVENIGPLETKDAHRNRLKWYANIAVLATNSIEKLIGLRAG